MSFLGSREKKSPEQPRLWLVLTINVLVITLHSVNYHIVGAHLFFLARATQRRHTSTEFYTLGCEFFHNKPEDHKHGNQLFDD